MGKRKGEQGLPASPSQPSQKDAEVHHKKKKRKTLEGAGPTPVAKPLAAAAVSLKRHGGLRSQQTLQRLAKEAKGNTDMIRDVAAAAKKLQKHPEQPSKKSSKTTPLGQWLQQAQQDYLRAWTTNKALTWRQFINGYTPPATRPATPTLTVRQLLLLPPERLAKLSIETIKQLPHPVVLALQHRLDNANFFTPEAAGRHPTPMLPLIRVPVSVCQPPHPAAASSQQQQQQSTVRKLPCLVTLPVGSSPDTDAWEYTVKQSKPVNAAEPKVKVEVKPDPSTTITGSSTDRPLHNAPQPRYALGLFDPETQQLRLMPLASASAIRLQPRIKGLAYQPKAATAEEVAARTAAAADLQHQRQRNVKLVQEFGSTRRQRTQKQREEGTVRSNKLNDQGQLHVLMTNVQERGSAEGATQQGLLDKLGGYRNIPPHHPEATTPQQAYVLPEVFSSVWGAVNSGQLLSASEDAAVLAQLKERHQVVPYVLGRIGQLAPSSTADQAGRKQRAKALTLLNIVLRLLSCGVRVRAPRQQHEEGDEAAAVGGPLAAVARKLRIRQQEVLEGLLDQYYHPMADGQGWEAEPGKLELLLLSGLVLALAAEGWSLSTGLFDGLRGELKKTPQELAAKFRELGCICKAVKLPAAGAQDAPSGSTGTTTYAVALLSGAAAGTTLGDKLPKIKLMSKQRR